MRIRVLMTVAALLGLLGACDDSPRHPLDDSETRPATAAEALAEANAMLDEVGEAVIAGVTPTATEWLAPDGCGTNPDSPEQGDLGRILSRSFGALPAGSSAADVIAAASGHWEAAGHTVGPGAPNMPTQTITRINGISYSVVDAPPGVEARAFLPCY